MKKVRGLSAQEKQKAILDIFFETVIITKHPQMKQQIRDIFNKEEIEKEAKKKRVNNPQEIQDIVKNLVQDNLVNKEKVGSGAFFWSFPHEKKQEMVKVGNNIQEKKDQCIIKIQETEQKIELETQLRSSPDRQEQLGKFLELKSIYDKKQKQLNTLKKNDPQRVEELRIKIEEFRKLANLWGDNIETLIFYIKKKFYMSSQDILRYRENLEIEQEIEYIETV